MTQEIISQIDLRVNAITDLEIEAINSNNKTERIKLNAIKMELLEMKIFVCNLAQEEISKMLNK